MPYLVRTTGLRQSSWKHAASTTPATITHTRTGTRTLKDAPVHALTDIDKGEEITISYLRGHSNHEARRTFLGTKFGFACLCGLCSLPIEQSQECDRRLDEIKHLEHLMEEKLLGKKASLVPSL
jgi:hypothetical protein